MYKLFICSLFLLNLTNALGQVVVIQGKVSDTTGQALSFANIIADPDDRTEIRYAVSDRDGFYKIGLSRGKTYTVSVTFLGYKTGIKKIRVTRDSIVHFILIPSLEQLDEVVIKARAPIVIKPDTITFRSSAFVKGGERKLKDILKNIPGMEVDNQGNVKFQGRQVSTVLVENQKFFSGRTPLATNHIPSDAVEEIQIIDDFEETGFMKRVRNSGMLALNIKLKAHKKKFWFGLIEAGAGPSKRFLFHPSIYRFSTKFQMNIIGDFNNTGESSFTFSDLLNFEQLDFSFSDFFKTYKTYNRLFNYSDFFYAENRFSGIHLSKKHGKNQLTAYLITQNPLQIAEKNDQKLSLLSDSLDQFQTTFTNTRGNFLLAKLKYRNQELYIRDFSYEISYTQQTPSFFQKKTKQNNNRFSSLTDVQEIYDSNLSQNIYWKKNRDRSISVFKSQMTLDFSNERSNWLSSEFLYNPFITYAHSDTLDILQVKRHRTFQWQNEFKHYFLYHDQKQFIYTAGFLMANQQLHTDARQKLPVPPSYFELNPLKNNLYFSVWDFYYGLSWRLYIGEWIGKVGFKQHFFTWKIHNNYDKENIRHLKRIEPLVQLTNKQDNLMRISFLYTYKLKIPSIEKLYRNYYLTDFFSLAQGFSFDRPARWHETKFKINYYDKIKKMSLGISIGNKFKIHEIVSDQTYQSLFTLTRYRSIDFSGSSHAFMLRASKWWRNLKISYAFAASKALLKRFVNGQKKDFSYDQTSHSISLQTTFSQSIPNFYLKIGNRQIKTGKVFQRHLNETTLKFEADYNSKNWTFKTDYSKHWIPNFSNVILDNVNAVIIYKFDDSPWEIEISGRNLLNNRMRYKQSITDFWIQTHTEYIVPRIILLKIIYSF